MVNGDGSRPYTALCMACSSSLPPSKGSSSKSVFRTDVFVTLCCHRPICPACVAGNPRLTRYNPCLACLGGVGAVGTSIRDVSTNRDYASAPPNVDGAVRDEDTYVIGDDGDKDEGIDADVSMSYTPPPAYVATPVDPVMSSESSVHDSQPVAGASEQEVALGASDTVLPRYYIKPSDTLQGIAFRFGVDRRELCRLNKLPPSTLTTTRHLLHTRSTLELPSSARGKLVSVDSTEGNDADREARRARERAEKRLQTMTKETDWRIARAYVALADDPEEMYHYKVKMKEESGVRTGLQSGSMGCRALEQYLDDDEWEEGERRAGRTVSIQPFPFSSRKGAVESSSVAKASGW